MFNPLINIGHTKIGGIIFSKKVKYYQNTCFEKKRHIIKANKQFGQNRIIENEFKNKT